MPRHKPLKFKTKKETSRSYFNGRKLFYLFLFTFSFLFFLTTLSIIFAPTENYDDPAFYHTPPVGTSSRSDHRMDRLNDLGQEDDQYR